MSSTTVAPVATDPAPRPWSADEQRLLSSLGIGPRLTLTDYYELHNRNMFLGERVMLLDGVVYLESPMDPPHAAGIRRATRAIERAFAVGYDVRVQLPLDLSLTTEPHPDVAVVVGTFEDYETAHPTTAELVIEISDSTVAFDTGEKANLYAAGGIADYWVIDIPNRRVHVFRDPRPDANEVHGHAYFSRGVFGNGDALTPLAAPTAVLTADQFVR